MIKLRECIALRNHCSRFLKLISILSECQIKLINFNENVNWHHTLTGSSATSPAARHNHPAANSPRPELTTMTNVNVLDLQMNSHPPSLSRDSDDETKKNSRSENYDDNEAIW